MATRTAEVVCCLQEADHAGPRNRKNRDTSGKKGHDDANIPQEHRVAHVPIYQIPEGYGGLSPWPMYKIAEDGGSGGKQWPWPGCGWKKK